MVRAREAEQRGESSDDVENIASNEDLYQLKSERDIDPRSNVRNVQNKHHFAFQVQRKNVNRKLLKYLNLNWLRKLP